jgi:hypothetical protein
VAGTLPGSVAGQAAQVVRQSFIDGVVAGSLVSAGACLAAAIAAFVFLPARHAAAASDPAAGGTGTDLDSSELVTA